MYQHFREIYNILKNNGAFVILAGSMEMYKHNWLSLYTNYPENLNPKSGEKVKIKLMNANLVLEDYFWTDNDYRTTAKKAKFKLLKYYNPLGTKNDKYNWKDETKFSPYSIYIFRK